ncbi:Ig-like domain-containing protein [Actinoplanes sp. NPDC049599]|uniref:Ig-like domain-containing protein n=1 Tax=Actinoplanes sp. NPDC049599 TaxID=3363903 RepID=UPI0037A95485
MLANDTGTGLTVGQVGGAAHGTAELRAGGVWYTPQATFRGTDTFTYTAYDHFGRAVVGTVRVTVPNAAPAITAVSSRTVTAGETLVVPFALADGNDDPLTLAPGTPSGAPGAAARINAAVTGSRLTLAVDVRLSGHVTIPVTVSDGIDSAGTELRVTVLPAPARAATGRVIANPQARAQLADPTFAGGRPVSRSLSTFVDSLVTWRVSPTAALLGYRVTLNGVRICTVRAVTGATTQSCRVRAAVDTGDALRVTAVGIDGTLSASIGAAITPASATNRLLAVIYFPTGEFSLDATARGVLATVSLQARRYGFGTALMVGHTDADGTAAANATLSRRRADQVAEYFHRVYPALRADHTGRGETDPARPNVSDRDKAANRRVEVYVG